PGRPGQHFSNSIAARENAGNGASWLEERIMTFKVFICSALMAAFIGIGYAQSFSYNFDNNAFDKPPAGFTSYATGGGPAGKWLVKEMSDAPSSKHVVEQTDADSTDTRFPVLIADNGEYADLDVSVKGKAL